VEQHGHADADCEAADGGNQRLLITGKDLEEIGGVGAKSAVLRRLQEFADIGTRRIASLA
jgi:hypothetical protein